MDILEKIIDEGKRIHLIPKKFSVQDSWVFENLRSLAETMCDGDELEEALSAIEFIAK